MLWAACAEGTRACTQWQQQQQQYNKLPSTWQLLAGGLQKESTLATPNHAISQTHPHQLSHA
jgi:hypothetical protein